MQAVKFIIHLLRIAKNYNLDIQIANVSSKDRLYFKICKIKNICNITYDWVGS